MDKHKNRSNRNRRNLRRFFALQTDEFNIYEAKEVEGVLTIVGVRYSLGMMNSGTVDIPLAK